MSKTKFMVADLPDSSITARITPPELGELLAKCRPDQFRVAIESFIATDTQFNMMDNRKPTLLAKAARLLCEKTRARDMQDCEFTPLDEVTAHLRTQRRSLIVADDSSVENSNHYKVGSLVIIHDKFGYIWENPDDNHNKLNGEGGWWVRLHDKTYSSYYDDSNVTKVKTFNDIQRVVGRP